jgi:hypothetical protein
VGLCSSKAKHGTKNSVVLGNGCLRQPAKSKR